MNHLSAGPGMIRRAGHNGTVFTPYTRPQPVRRFPPPLRTFFTTDASEGSALKVKVTAGAINGVSKIEDTYDVTSSGVVYLHVTINEAGIATALAVGVANELPANEALEGYTLLAILNVITPEEEGTPYLKVTPVAWNYSQLQVCGTVADEGDVSVFLWGGFGE